MTNLRLQITKATRINAYHRKQHRTEFKAHKMQCHDVERLPFTIYHEPFNHAPFYSSANVGYKIQG